MSDERKCLRCGGTNLEPGRMQGNGVLCFRPKSAKFLTLQTADVKIAASMCLDCGKSLTNKNEPA